MGYEDNDADDLLLNAARSGAPGAKFPSIGYILKGTVTKRPSKAAQTDVDRKPKVFDDGTPRMQVLIEVQTDLRDPDIADDDGLRTIWCKWEIQKAISQALLNAGLKRLEVGGLLQVGRIQDEPPSKKGYKPTQKFVAKYDPPAQVAADDIFAPHASTAPQNPVNVPQGTVFETQHQDRTAPPKAVTTLDQLAGMNFSAQGFPQDQAPPF